MSSANEKIASLLDKEIIKIIHLNGNFLIFEPASIVNCMKINIHVDLIGPCPRLLVSEKTGLPGLLTPYQASILLQSPNVKVFNGKEEVDSEQLVDFEDKFYLQLERDVKKSHLEIAASYGQDVDIPAALEKFTELAQCDRRWRVNFLDHGALTKTNDGSKCSTMPEIKGLDALKDKCHRYLWQCGYYLTSGMKYGCDWLAYEHPPDLVHAKYIVSVLDVDKKLRSSDIAARSRIATKSKKKWLLLSVVNDRVEGSVISWNHRRY